MKTQIIMSLDEYKSLEITLHHLLYNIKDLPDSYTKNELMRFIEDAFAICKLEDE